MKKIIRNVIIWVLGMVGVAIANNVVLLKYHPLEFYYTPKGLMVTAIVMGVECLMLYPLSWWYAKKFLCVESEESTEEEL